MSDVKEEVDLSELVNAVDAQCMVMYPGGFRCPNPAQYKVTGHDGFHNHNTALMCARCLDLQKLQLAFIFKVKCKEHDVLWVEEILPV